MVYDTKDKKLISGAVQFFEANRTMKEIYASEDGQYFHTVSNSNYHCKQHGLKVFRITRAQAIQQAKPAETAKSEPAIPEIKTEAKVVPPPKKKAGRPAAKPAGGKDKNAKTEK